MIQQSHSWAHIWRETKDTGTPMSVAPLFTQPGHGRDLNGHLRLNG